MSEKQRPYIQSSQISQYVNNKIQTNQNALFLQIKYCKFKIFPAV